MNSPSTMANTMSELHKSACDALNIKFEQEKDNNKNSSDDEWKTLWCKKIRENHQDCAAYTDNCGDASKADEPKTDESENDVGDEAFTMMNDNKSMNSILVFGLFVILFLFVYMYGFHGILKFEKNLNYLIAILFSGLGIILSIMLIIGSIRHVSSSTMSDEEKSTSRSGLLVIVVLIIFFSMMGIIRYNYGKLFNALNKSLPANNTSLFGSKSSKGKKRGPKKGRK